MKKIISLFCTLAMVISMAAVAHADENNYVEWKLVSKEGGNAVVEAHLVTNENATACPMFWNFADAFDKGATNVTIEKVEAGIANFTNKDGQIFVQLNKTSVDGYTGDITLARVTVVGITENFEISLMPNSGRTATKVTNTDKAVVTDKFTFATQSFVLKEEVTPSVDVANEVIVKAAASNPEEANTVGIKATATPVNGGTFTKLTANLNNGSKDASVVVYEGTAIDAVTVFGLNIMQVPADVTITVTSVVAE